MAKASGRSGSSRFHFRFDFASHVGQRLRGGRDFFSVFAFQRFFLTQTFEGCQSLVGFALLAAYLRQGSRVILLCLLVERTAVQFHRELSLALLQRRFIGR